MKLPSISKEQLQEENIVFEKYFEELESFKIIGSFSPMNGTFIKQEFNKTRADGYETNYIDTTKVIILQLK